MHSSDYEWAKTQSYSPQNIAHRLWKCRTGLWWNIPRNIGYIRRLTEEVQARAAMRQERESARRFVLVAMVQIRPMHVFVLYSIVFMPVRMPHRYG